MWFYKANWFFVRAFKVVSLEKSFQQFCVDTESKCAKISNDLDSRSLFNWWMWLDMLFL